MYFPLLWKLLKGQTPFKKRTHACIESHAASIRKGLFVCCPPIHSFAADGRLGQRLFLVSVCVRVSSDSQRSHIYVIELSNTSPGSRLILFDSWEIDAKVDARIRLHLKWFHTLAVLLSYWFLSETSAQARRFEQTQLTKNTSQNEWIEFYK